MSISKSEKRTSCRCGPVVASQVRIVLSMADVNAVAPSGENAAPQIQNSCAGIWSSSRELLVSQTRIRLSCPPEAAGDRQG